MLEVNEFALIISDLFNSVPIISNDSLELAEHQFDQLIIV
jgi:hypothetical protein